MSRNINIAPSPIASSTIHQCLSSAHVVRNAAAARSRTFALRTSAPRYGYDLVLLVSVSVGVQGLVIKDRISVRVQS